MRYEGSQNQLWWCCTIGILLKTDRQIDEKEEGGKGEEKKSYWTVYLK